MWKSLEWVVSALWGTITTAAAEKPASQPCLPASLLQSFLQNIHVPHSDRHIIQSAMGRNLIKQQNAANVRSFIPSQSANQQRTHISRRSHIPASQLIKWIRIAWINGCRVQGSRMTRTSFFFVFCGQLLRTWHVLSCCQARRGTMLFRRRISSTQ